MTVTIETNRDIYTATGSRTSFPCTFKYFEDTDLTVAYVDDSSDDVTYYDLNVDYVVTDNNVIFTTAPEVGGKVIVWGTYDNQQQTDYLQGDSFLMNVHEDSIDKLTLLMMRNHDNIGRIPKFAGGLGFIIPEPEATKLLGWNSTADSMANYTNPISDATTTELSNTSAANYKSLANKWANNPENTVVASNKYSAYHWSLKTRYNSEMTCLHVYETTADGTTLNGKDVFYLPWNFDGNTATISVYLDGVRIYPSGYTIVGTDTVLMEDNVPIGTAVLIVAKEYDSGYILDDTFVKPAADLSNSFDLPRVKTDSAEYELLGFEHFGFDVGTKCWFYRDTAPIGWVIDSTVGDALLAIKDPLGGYTEPYACSGGNTGGSWSVPSIGIPNHYHSVGDHTLTANEMTAHTHIASTIGGDGAHTHDLNHRVYIGKGGESGQYGIVGIGDDKTGRTRVIIGNLSEHEHDITVTSDGGNGSHNHNNTGGPEATGTVDTGDWRPYAAVGIICRKLRTSVYEGPGGGEYEEPIVPSGIVYTIDHTKISSNLANFPVGITISGSEFITQRTASEWENLHVTVGDTECYTEVDNWDVVNGDAVLWIKIPSISSTADTTININIGDTNVAYIGELGDTPAQAVWSGYDGIYHMSMISGTSVLDSSSNSYDLFCTCTSYVEDINDIITSSDWYNCLKLATLSEPPYANYAHGYGIELAENFTIAIKFTITSTTVFTHGAYLIHQGATMDEYGLQFIIISNPAGAIKIRYKITSPYSHPTVISTLTCNDMDTNIVIASFGGVSNGCIFNINGETETVEVTTDYSEPSSNEFTIGAYTYDVDIWPSAYRFYGKIDELFVIEDRAYSAAEVEAMYHVLANDLITEG